MQEKVNALLLSPTAETTERLQLTLLQAAIDDALEQHGQGLGKLFDKAAIEKITVEGRRILPE